MLGVLSAVSEMPRNFEPDLGDKAAPILTPPVVSFKPGGHCGLNDTSGGASLGAALSPRSWILNKKFVILWN